MSALPFHPLVSEWFKESFAAATPAQRESWRHIQANSDVLIAAPTGSGKTLAAFLAGINRLVERATSGTLQDHTYIIYVSPLKALSNDIRRNLEVPLAAISEAAGGLGIRSGLRTGDTPQADRARMLKQAPHILVTTPESLYLMVTAEKSRRMLAKAETVIVDEIHAIAGSKRGAHLALTLERLDKLVTQEIGCPPQRVGVSATQKPIELIARLLVGHGRKLPHIVDSGHARKLDIEIELTDDELGAVATNEQMARVYDRMATLISEHNTTLLFVNTRKMVERASHLLAERLGEDQVVAHHGSISRKLRFIAEQKLKSGDVKVAVATASLELGIDVGDVDLVIQMGSPRSIAVMLQRIGRAGHSLGKTPKGRLFALTRDQLVECVALVRAIREGRLDAVVPSRLPLDILAQQIVAASACEDLAEDDIFALARRAFHFADLTREQFDEVLHILAEGTSSRRGRVGARIFRDRIGGTISGRRGARLIALTCGGAIPETANYPVVMLPDNIRIGDLDEDFAIESMAGDIVLLGNTSWRILRVSEGKVFVEDAHGAPPNVPFWFGEAPARTRELCDEVADLREWFAELRHEGTSIEDIIARARRELQLSKQVAEMLCHYLAAGLSSLGAMPTNKRIVVERFFDDGGGMQLVVHAPLGGRVNRAWGLALRKRFCKSFNFELQAAATDDGIVISLGQPHSFPLEDVARFLHPNDAEPTLIQAMLDSAYFEARWRWNTTRALAVPRRRGGKKVPPHILRMRCDDLLSVVFPMAQACQENIVGPIEIPDHPLVKQTVNDCLHEAMDIDGLRDTLSGILDGSIEFIGQDTVEPSLFAHELINANPYAFLDDTPLEERRTRAVSLRRGLGNIEDSALRIETHTVDALELQLNHVPRDTSELHDRLLGDFVYPATDDPHSLALFDALAGSQRAHVYESDGGKTFWVAAENLSYVATVVPGRVDGQITALPFTPIPLEPETIAMRIVQAYLSRRGPRTESQIIAATGLDRTNAQVALATLEGDGAVFQGNYTCPDIQWVDRQVLARLHKNTLRQLRKSIEPVAPAAVMRFLFAWQRVAPDYQLQGDEGLETIIGQLQGYHAPASAWESDILSARLCDYAADRLDRLCVGGQVTWGRLQGKASGVPSKSAPISLLMREDAGWLQQALCKEIMATDLDDNAGKVAMHLSEHGASFMRDISENTSLSPEQTEAALWDLVSAGLVSADSFGALRALLCKKSDKVASKFDVGAFAGSRSSKWTRAVRRARGRDNRRPSSTSRPAAAGRWWLLSPTQQVDADQLSLHVADQMLERYGIVFRDLLARENINVPWRELVRHYYRMESQGQLRSGHFVSSFPGPQFALPEALSLLRSFRNPPRQAQTITISAADPLNLVGILHPGKRIVKTAGNQVVFRDGVPIAAIEAGKMRELGDSPTVETLRDTPPEIQPGLWG